MSARHHAGVFVDLSISWTLIQANLLGVQEFGRYGAIL